MGITKLKGITWGHSRGITPLLAASQRYSELYPGVEISWHKRTLQEFADFPIEKLTHNYDLLVIDHPWVGCAADLGCVVDLAPYVGAKYLHNQLENSVGGSHESYEYEDRQWALAIDAAAPAASYRADLFHDIPQTWEQLLALAATGKVAVPAIPIDLLMNFYTFCIACGAEPFTSNDRVIDDSTGLAALNMMRQLYSLVDQSMFEKNPIAVAEVMTTTDQYWYCPFAYPYSNYSRNGYAATTLTYTDVVSFNGNKLLTTLGGTGLAISAFSPHRDEAIRFAAMTASEQWQSTLYVQHGGQPGHATAWSNPLANEITNNFFTNLLPLMQRSYTRPRNNGYLRFQDHAGDPLQQYLLGNGTAIEVLDTMNQLYRETKAHTHSKLSV